MADVHDKQTRSSTCAEASVDKYNNLSRLPGMSRIHSTSPDFFGENTKPNRLYPATIRLTALRGLTDLTLRR